MGGADSKTSYCQTQKRPPISSGFLGRDRMAQSYPRNVRIYVDEITAPVLGKELVRRCGNDEGKHRDLDAAHYTTLRFLRAAISFVPDALDDGGNMRNAAFILSQPGKEFVIQAGNGDWEFYFSEEANGEIYGRCVRKPFICYVWDGLWSVVSRIGVLLSYAESAVKFAGLLGW